MRRGVWEQHQKVPISTRVASVASYGYTNSYPYKLPMLTIARSSTLSHLPRLRKDRLPFSYAAGLGAPCELSILPPRTSSPARDMNQAPMPGRPSSKGWLGHYLRLCGMSLFAKALRGDESD
ncbi:hypothetical protein V8C43DRAFT_209900 [Trichoderma afarasin]